MFLLKILVFLATSFCFTDGISEEEVLSVLRGEQGQYFCPGTNFCETNKTGVGKEKPSKSCCNGIFIFAYFIKCKYIIVFWTL